MIVVAFECFGNIEENNRIARQLGFHKQFKGCVYRSNVNSQRSYKKNIKSAKKVFQEPYGYVCFNLSPSVLGNEFRVATNLFSERFPFLPMFHTE